MMPSLRRANLARYKDIAWLLLKYGRSDFIEACGLGELAAGAKPADDDSSRARGDNLARDLETMGPTFVKLGQVLSTRADLLPRPYLESLARLQDRVEPFPFDQARQTIEEDLGVSLGEAFAVVEPEPMAAASLGQVHRAVLLTGEPVVVKVQRPGVRQQIQRDLEALQEIARVLDSHTDFGRRYRLLDVLRQFRRTLIEEMDYTQEACNLVTLHDNLREFPRIVVPLPVQALTTPRVLTMELVEGCKITQLPPDRLSRDEGMALAEHVFHAYLEQGLTDGFFHADPHPGNVILTPDNRIGLLDLGMTGRISPQMQEQLLALLHAISRGRSDDAVDVAIRMGYADKNFDAGRFGERIGEIVSLTQGKNVRGMPVGQIVMEVAQIAGETGLRIPAQFTMLGKVLLQLQQVGAALAPDFDPNEAIRRHSAELIEKRMLKSLSPSHVLAAVLDLRQFISKLPRRIDRLLDVLTSNDLEIKVDAIDEDRLIKGLQKIANRITVGLVLAALIVGAALLMQIETRATILGYPLFAMLCFLLAAGLGFILVINVMFGDTHGGRK